MDAVVREGRIKPISFLARSGPVLHRESHRHRNNVVGCLDDILQERYNNGNTSPHSPRSGAEMQTLLPRREESSRLSSSSKARLSRL